MKAEFHSIFIRLLHYERMKNILGTVAKVGIAVVLLRIVGFLVVAGLVIWIISALLF